MVITLVPGSGTHMRIRYNFSLEETSINLANFYTLPETWAFAPTILVFMTKTGVHDSTVNSQRKDMLITALAVLGGAPAVVAGEVPWTYFIAPGVPPHRHIV